MQVSSNKPQHLLFISLTTLLSFATPAVETTNSFIYAACFPSQYLPVTSFQSNLNSLLASIANSASSSPYKSFSSGNTSASAAYGLYQCRNDLTAADCSSCVQSAVGQIGLVCPGAYAAALQLDGCLVRYRDEDFLGKLDMAVAYRKCSREVSGGEFLRRRDDVLGELGSGRGFRVSSSGDVQGFAQCEGDLGAGDCESCLKQAVEQLRDVCGESLAGDLFLRQCYARVWASGYYPRAAVAPGLLLLLLMLLLVGVMGWNEYMWFLFVREGLRNRGCETY